MTNVNPVKVSWRKEKKHCYGHVFCRQAKGDQEKMCGKFF
uniref:Uncharacterized protein n=1 Tax=Arundo donax TaxID=35708 RepID=A0A0A9FKF3_ARUDO